MTLETLRAVLGWSALFNILLLSVWFLVFTCAHDALYRLHRLWFNLSPETFDGVLYGVMAFCKILTWVFFIVPWLALCVLT